MLDMTPPPSLSDIVRTPTTLHERWLLNWNDLSHCPEWRTRRWFRADVSTTLLNYPAIMPGECSEDESRTGTLDLEGGTCCITATPQIAGDSYTLK